MARQALLNLFFLAFVAIQRGGNQVKGQGIGGFVEIDGTQFVVNGSIFYFNGFNAYWMMLKASSPSERAKVTTALRQASSHGLTVARTWAFSDGGQWPLQSSPGSYNETMFRGLDFVVSEAKRYGMHLILSFVNNYEAFGGRKQYVEWARERGQNVSSDDDFYKNNVVKSYYKNHIKTILTRINTRTGVAYKDDPTIFAWELINEPHCESDLSGEIFQGWIEEMSALVKSIDGKHLLEIGSEGFYGQSMPQRKQFNPNGYTFGTDFISNNQVKEIDFATIHAYPDLWLPGSAHRAQLNFLWNWTEARILDTAAFLKKPLLVTELGKSINGSGPGVAQRDAFFLAAYASIYNSARTGGPLAGGLFWQLLTYKMDNLRDGYEIILPENPSTAKIISQLSRKLSKLRGHRKRH